MRIRFEKIVRTADSSFACHAWDAAAFDCPYHTHPEFEIVHVQASRGSRLVGDRLDHYAPGDLLLIGPNVPHMFVTDQQPAGGRAKSRYVQFDAAFLGEGWLALPEFGRVRGLLAEAQRGVAFAGPGRRASLAVLDTLFAAEGVARIARLLELLDVLASSRGRRPLASEAYAAGAEHADADRVERALTYINAHIAEELRLDDVARHAHLTPQAFSRFFRRHMGRTYIDYVTHLRIGRACRLMLESDLPITQVAYASGFANVSNFNRHFRRIKKLPPRDYRNRAAAEPS